jgi:kynurenine formamidase
LLVRIVDLSRELYHRTPAHPSHPPVAIGVWNDHDEIKRAGSTEFTSKALHLQLSDHAGSHVDAFCHFDPSPDAAGIDAMPLDMFYGPAFCVDLRDVPLKHEVTADELAAAVDRSGVTIEQGDIVLILLGTNERLWGSPGYLHDFAGLHVDAVHWLADQGVKNFGVEAISPAPQGEPNFKAHLACAERGITHMECLWNLEAVAGLGKFTFAGFPLRIRGGTASPIRAVAILGD